MSLCRFIGSFAITYPPADLRRVHAASPARSVEAAIGEHVARCLVCRDSRAADENADTSLFLQKKLEGETESAQTEDMKKAPLIEAFGYIRVSGRGQLDGDGFPRQRAAIEKHAAAAGIRIVRWFEERAVCGATEWENRPAWSEMVQKLNGVRTIVIERLDRLARELFIQEYILRDLKQRGVELVSAAEPDLDSDPGRVLFRQMMGAIAQYDRTMTVLKLRAARKRQRASGARCEGRKPYGSRPGEQDTINRMRALRNAGETFDRIAAALNAENVATRTAGRQWFGSTVAKILQRTQ